MLSKTTKYAIRSLIRLAEENDAVVSVSRLHTELDIPYKYLARVMKNLADENLAIALQGKQGGYKLARPAEEISLYDIITCIEGEGAYQGCLIGTGECHPGSSCCVHGTWAPIRRQILDVFNHTTLKDILKSECPSMSSLRVIS